MRGCYRLSSDWQAKTALSIGGVIIVVSIPMTTMAETTLAGNTGSPATCSGAAIPTKIKPT